MLQFFQAQGCGFRFPRPKVDCRLAQAFQDRNASTDKLLRHFCRIRRPRPLIAPGFTTIPDGLRFFQGTSPKAKASGSAARISSTAMEAQLNGVLAPSDIIDRSRPKAVKAQEKPSAM